MPATPKRTNTRDVILFKTADAAGVRLFYRETGELSKPAIARTRFSFPVRLRRYR
jgi:hypothetical protein